MILKIFDVTHGFCACLIGDTGHALLIDCGHNELTGFRPSGWLAAQGIKRALLVIQNFDQDHVSDLPNLTKPRIVAGVIRNTTIPPAELLKIKLESGSLTPAMKAVIFWHKKSPPTPALVERFLGTRLYFYYNRYPTFTDTNNLSVVTFVHYHGVGVVFPGDLETAGWRALLGNLPFRRHLQRVNIFVASHHGRTTGYCKEVFDYCKPDVIIVSDKEKVYDTQNTNYTQYANGVSRPGRDGNPETRYVFTTRSDGDVSICKTPGIPYKLTVGLPWIK